MARPPYGIPKCPCREVLKQFEHFKCTRCVPDEQVLDEVALIECDLEKVKKQQGVLEKDQNWAKYDTFYLKRKGMEADNFEKQHKIKVYSLADKKFRRRERKLNELIHDTCLDGARRHLEEIRVQCGKAPRVPSHNPNEKPKYLRNTESRYLNFATNN
jgi:hypothetical protein